MTLGEIATEVDRNVNREGLSEIPSAIRARVRAAVKRWAEQASWPPLALGERGRGRVYDWTFLRSSHEFTTVASVATVTLPTDFLRRIRLVLTVAGAPHRPEPGDLDYLLERWREAVTGVPRDYAIDAEAGVLRLFPAPDQAYSGTLRYVKALPALAGDDDSNVFTERYPEGIICEATAAVLMTLRQWEEAAGWARRAGQELEAALRADRGAELERDIVVPIFTSARGTADNPRPISDEDWEPRRIWPLD